MKRKLMGTTGLAAVVCIFFATNGAAEFQPKNGDFGVGLVLGSPSGITGKYWLNDRNAFDASIGFGDLTVQADYLWHSWTIFPKPPSGTVAGYIGLGGRFEEDDHNDYHHDDHHNHDGSGSVGVRVPFGATYFLPRAPFELFLELVPVLEFTDHTDLELDAGLGGRFYFGRSSSRN